jgi:hypothetical protein
MYLAIFCLLLEIHPDLLIDSIFYVKKVCEPEFVFTHTDT